MNKPYFRTTWQRVSFSRGSSDNDGLWMRFSPHQAHTVEAYELSYWEDLDSSAIATHGKYNVQAGYVDLSRIESAALASCGIEINPDGQLWCPHTGEVLANPGTQSFSFAVAECMWRYGSKQVELDSSGNNRRALIAAARSVF